MHANPPYYKWFSGGKINIIDNAIDRHQLTAVSNKLAIIWEGEPGDVRTFSYHALNREVCQFANILKSMGVKKGDVVTIYTCPRYLNRYLQCWPVPRLAPYIAWFMEASALKRLQNGLTAPIAEWW